MAKRSGAGKKANRDLKKDKVWVCRGCCCGTRAKHPGVDHRALEQQLRQGAAGSGFGYEVTDCLGPCGQGNVVVVRTDGRLRWFRRMNSEAATAALVGSLGGGEGLPVELDGHRLRKHDGTKP